MANFTPVGAFAIFAASKLKSKYTPLFVFGSLFVSDIILGLSYINLFVYIGFAIYYLLGININNYKSLIANSILASILFFAITNFGSWIGPWYPHTLNGLIDCFVKAIPFYRGTILGDLFYIGAFFGAYELVRFYNLRVRKPITLRKE